VVKIATPLGNMVVHLGLDNSGFAQKLTESSNSLKSFQRSIATYDRQLRTSDAHIKYAKNGAEAFRAYGDKINTLKGAIQQQSLYQNKLAQDFERSKTATGELTDQSYRLAKSYQEGQAKLVAYRGELANAIKEQYSQHSVIARAGQGLTNISQGLGRISSATRGMSAALTIGFGAAVKSAAEFENGMMTIQALIADDVPATKLTGVMTQLSDSVKKYATEYGLSTDVVIEGMTEMIRRGYDANQTMAAMPHVLEASKASGEHFGTVMHATTAILEQFNLKAEDTQRVTDSLTFVANKTAADFSSIGVAMEYVGPMAATAGISLEETAAAVGLLSQRGIEGEKAGTNLRNVLTALVKPTKSQKAAFDELGISVEEFRAGNLTLADVLDLARKNTEGLTGAQKAALFSQAVGKTGQAGFNALIAQGGDALRNLTKETENAHGATKRMAETMMQSSQNQLAKAKAEFEVLGIEIGSKLLPIINDFLKEGIKVIDWFKELSPETQTMIVKFGLAAAAVSPFTGVLSLLTGALGKTLTGVASLTGGIKATIETFKATKDITSITSSIASVGSSASTAAESVGGLASKGSLLTALFNPTSAVIAGVALLAGGLAYLSYQQDKAREATEEFGVAVSDTERRELRQFKNTVDESKNAINDFVNQADGVEKVSKAFKDMYDSIVKSAAEDDAKVSKLAKKWGLSEEQIENARKHNQAVVDNTSAMMNQVNEIYQRHNGDVSKFSAEEKEIVLNAQNEMIKAKLDVMHISKKKQAEILTALNGEIYQLNETQLKQSKASLEEAMKAENKYYQKSKEELKFLLEEKALTQEEYNTKLATLESEHSSTMERIGKKYYEVMQALDGKLKARTGQSWNYWEEAKKTLEEYGLSYEEIGKKASEASSKVGNSHSMLAKYTKDMSQSMREANDAWSLLVGNIDKNGTFTVKSNVKEVIGEATKSAEGWEKFKFIAKNANITTNARATIAEALVESGKWNEMTPEEKKLIVDGNSGLQAIFDSESHLKTWNSMPAEVKQLLMDNKEVMSKASLAKAALDNWNLLTPQQKELVAKDTEVRNAVNRSTQTLTEWDATNPFPKDLKVNPENGILNTQLTIDKLAQWNGTPADVKQIKVDPSSAVEGSAIGVGALGAYNSFGVPTKPITADASNATSQGQLAINKQSEWNALGSPTKPITADSSNALNAGQSAINKQSEWNALGSPTKPITADASSAIDAAGRADYGIRSIPTFWHTTITATEVVNRVVNSVGRLFGYERGTNYHKGGMAVVNDESGPLYRELVTLPSGEAFIPEGRNVMLSLPRGSKVLRASMTKKLFPHYKDGIGYEKFSENSPFFQKINSVRTTTVTTNNNQPSDSESFEKIMAKFSDMQAQMMSKVIELLERKGEPKLIINGREFGQLVEDITHTQQSQSRLNYYY